MVTALIALATGATGCADARADSKPAALPLVAVRVVPVERVALERPLRATGRLGQKHSLSLSFKNGGTLRALLVQEGAMVKKGERLAIVDPTEIAAQVAQARASVEKADRDQARIDRLHATAVVAQSDTDNAHTASDIAHATLAAALYNQAASVLVAPEDGRIDKRLVEVGEQVGPGSPIYAMSGSAAGLVARVGVVDRDLIGLSLGDPAHVELDALPGRVFPASVSEIARVPSLTSGTYEVELRVSAADAPLVAGMTTKVEIVRKVGPALPVVPLASLIDADGSHATLYALAPTTGGLTVQKVPIEIAYFAGDRVAVQSGLSGSEQILSEGASFVEPGRLVKPVEATEVADAHR